MPERAGHDRDGHLRAASIAYELVAGTLLACRHPVPLSAMIQIVATDPGAETLETQCQRPRPILAVHFPNSSDCTRAGR
jgi:hypothetical protein